MSPLAALAFHFGVLSLVAIGGIHGVLPEVHRVSVEVNGWVTDKEFAELFAIAQAAPGPNMLIVSLIGWQVGGVPGALVATAATCAPSCVLTYFFARGWNRFRGAPWRRAIELGIAPITVALVLSTGYLVARGADPGWTASLITAGSATFVAATRWNPLWAFVAAAALGLLGVV